MPDSPEGGIMASVKRICRRCGKRERSPRGECLPCKRAYTATYYATNAVKRREQANAYHAENPARRLLQSARQRARTKGLACTITANDIVLPTHCPVLGIPLWPAKGRVYRDNSPSLDRIDNTLGYTPGNVAVISWRANVLKRDATPEELRKILCYLSEQR